MKSVKQRIFSAMIVLALALSLVPIAHAATYDYAVEGGNLKFDPTTGTITDCDTSVYSAEIPSEIYGVPVTTIGERAFSSCSKLASITLPSTITAIGRSAFSRCAALRSIVIPNSVTTMGEEDIRYGGVFDDCKGLESVTISGSVERLPSGVFKGCSNLKTVNLEYGVEEIGTHAFWDCKNLKSIILPDSVKSIEKYTFGNCDNLTTGTIGSGIKNIDGSAFYMAKKLETLYFRGNAPSAGKDIVTHFADGFTIYYPQGASGWTTPTWNGYITKSYQLDPPKPVTPPPSSLVTAVPTSSKVYVNGTAVAFDAYNIKDNNYFKLRDLAFVLSGSKAQFEVSWDGAANAIRLTSGQPYTPVGGEMSSKGAINKVGEPTNSVLYLDGKQVSFTAYNIDNNNYFKLRDIGQALNFSVEWNGATSSIEINTSLPYRPE